MSRTTFSHRSLKRFATLALVAATFGIIPGFASAITTGNLLTDPGFESNPLVPISQVLNSPFSQNVWGDEMSTITGTVGAVSPASGTKMLSMTDDGQTATQTLQKVDVSAYSASINAGTATGDCNALFNVDSSLPAAIAAVYLQFQDSSNNYIGNTNINMTSTLDSNPATWQSLSLSSVPIPVNTNFLVMQVVYNDASLLTTIGVTGAGYVDDAQMTLTTNVPEPASMGLLACGAATMLRRPRRK